MARGLAVAVVALLVAAAPAQATSGTFTCPNLQAGIDQAQNSDVITVDGVCTGQFTLKNFGTPPGAYNTRTLQGVGGDDGFDRNNVPGRALTGHDTHRLLIQDLMFRDSQVTGAGQSGGAIELTGESALQLFNCSFFNNHADNRGGAVHLSQEPAAFAQTLTVISALGNVFGSTTNAAEGNSATIGGALSVETPGQGQNSALTSNLFANNTATWDGGAFDFDTPRSARRGPTRRACTWFASRHPRARARRFTGPRPRSWPGPAASATSSSSRARSASRSSRYCAAPQLSR